MQVGVLKIENQELSFEQPPSNFGEMSTVFTKSSKAATVAAKYLQNSLKEPKGNLIDSEEKLT